MWKHINIKTVPVGKIKGNGCGAIGKRNAEIRERNTGSRERGTGIRKQGTEKKKKGSSIKDQGSRMKRELIKKLDNKYFDTNCTDISGKTGG